MTTWAGPIEISSAEERVLKLCKKQKLWNFLRTQRHVLLDSEMRSALSELYKDTPHGRPPECPEQLLLAMLLQVAFDVPDHEVPTLTAVDLRWQMVLDCMGAKTAIVSQGTIFNFRERVRNSGLMSQFLEKTVVLARESKGFSHKRLRAIFDSSPLLGAGRIEDTFNLLGRAIQELVEVVAQEAGVEVQSIADELELKVVGASSIKASLDIDWRIPEERNAGLNALVKQFRNLEGWLQAKFSQVTLTSPPLVGPLGTARGILEQNTDPDPDNKGQTIMHQGRVEDRQASLTDPDMRHGRKSKSKAFTGYKRHVAVDADVPGLICAVKLLKGNSSEHEAVVPLCSSLDEQGFAINELHIDRGYLPAEKVRKMHSSGVRVVSKPPAERKGERYSKYAFEMDFEKKTVTCPAGESIALDTELPVLRFPAPTCRSCHKKTECITEKNTYGRQVRLHPKEQWYRSMSKELSTTEGRRLRRERIPVEHALARVGAIQGRRTRFRGQAKNQFELERVAVVNNLYILNRQAA